MKRENKKKASNAWETLLAPQHNAITLTFKNEVTQGRAKRFIRLINESLFGRRAVTKDLVKLKRAKDK